MSSLQARQGTVAQMQCKPQPVKRGRDSRERGRAAVLCGRRALELRMRFRPRIPLRRFDAEMNRFQQTAQSATLRKSWESLSGRRTDVEGGTLSCVLAFREIFEDMVNAQRQLWRRQYHRCCSNRMAALEDALKRTPHQCDRGRRKRWKR